MAKFLCSVCWNVDARLQDSFLYRKLDSIGSFQTGYGVVRAADNPYDAYRKGLAAMLSLKFNDNALQSFLQGLELGECKIESVNMYIGFCGILTMELFGDLQNHGDYKAAAENYENAMIAIANFLPGKLGEIGQIIQSLSGYLTIDNSYSFGQPLSFVEKGICDPAESYIYTYHLFVNDAKEAEEYHEVMGFRGDPIGVEGNEVWLNYASHLWRTKDLPDENLAHELSYADNSAAWEVLVYDVGAINYKNLLKQITQNKKCDCSILREMINRDNLMIQEICLSKREQTSEHHKLTMRAIDEYDGIPRGELFYKCQDMVKYAIDGMEAKEQAKSSSIIEVVLTVLTSMSVYSVVNDIYTLVTGREEVISFHMLSTLLLAFATIVMVIVLFSTVRRKSDK